MNKLGLGLGFLANSTFSSDFEHFCQYINFFSFHTSLPTWLLQRTHHYCFIDWWLIDGWDCDDWWTLYIVYMLQRIYMCKHIFKKSSFATIVYILKPQMKTCITSSPINKSTVLSCINHVVVMYEKQKTGFFFSEKIFNWKDFAANRPFPGRGVCLQLYSQSTQWWWRLLAP